MQSGLPLWLCEWGWKWDVNGSVFLGRRTRCFALLRGSARTGYGSVRAEVLVPQALHLFRGDGLR